MSENALKHKPPQKLIDDLCGAANSGDNMGLLKILDELNARFLDAKNTEGWTALIQAVIGGHIDTVALLLDKGANPNEKNTIAGSTALMWAARKGNTNIAALLLNRGANTDDEDHSGETALRWAALNGHTATAALLLERGANVNAKDDLGKTVLMSAVRGGHIDMVTLLLENGADFLEQTDNGWSAREWAKMFEREEIIALLDRWPEIAIQRQIEKTKREEQERADAVTRARVGRLKQHRPVSSPFSRKKGGM